ncbi:MAG: hypothetical protein NT128_04600 [Proteobacteria bacterium]|nr:hypothetical protein [Pseudomonadota bacterium]
MKCHNLDYLKKTVFIFLCVISLNFEAMCCCADLNLDGDNVKSKIASLALNTGSAFLGAVANWEALNGESTRGVKIANASTSLVAAVFKGYNGYWDWKNGKMKGAAHLALNGLIVGCNIASVVLSIQSAATDDHNQANIYNFASSLTNILGLGLKAVDLFITTSPYKSNRVSEEVEPLYPASTYGSSNL